MSEITLRPDEYNSAEIDLAEKADPLALSSEDKVRLAEVSARGTSPETIRAHEQDMRYISAWRRLRYDQDLCWPETEAVALAFIVDHSIDLANEETGSLPLMVAEQMVSEGIRASLDMPSPKTLDRRIASWNALHAERNLPTPFAIPRVRLERSKARKAVNRLPGRHSQEPILKDDLEAIITAMPKDLRGLRDRAMLSVAWASGGRRISEICNLLFSELDLSKFEQAGKIHFTLHKTKTTYAENAPRLSVSSRPAQWLHQWLNHSGVKDGFVFRRISRTGNVLTSGLSTRGLRHIMTAHFLAAGYKSGQFSPHGLRSGYVTHADSVGMSRGAIMKATLHRSSAQVDRYTVTNKDEKDEAADLF